ncbi:MAG: AmmeMemoRadiSam system protein B [Acidobacteriota bacterium]|nr:AmmeMemoRadiSam system protein B [Acidobacteriota bacterium]
MIRLPAVAGRFYPSEPEILANQIGKFVSGAGEKVRALGCIVPHAGYMYSGHVAGAVYASIEIPRRCILLGPRHFPRGEPLAILTRGSFATPLGEAQIDAELAASVAREYPRLREDAVAHAQEHSLEVQIPFLQLLVKDIRFVPIVLATDRYGAIEGLGRAVAKVIASAAEPVLAIASTDMNHYENDAATRVKDALAIERILALDPRGLFDTIRDEGISMCGYAATTAMLVAVNELRATEARLVRYATSADAGGDREQVVGYAGIVIR